MMSLLEAGDELDSYAPHLTYWVPRHANFFIVGTIKARPSGICFTPE